MLGAIGKLLDAVTDYTVGTAIVFIQLGIMGYHDNRAIRPALGEHAEVRP